MVANDSFVVDPNGVARCWWCGSDPLYMDYHDREWGHPVTNDQRLFEKICLEGFQAGLSWITILRKRQNFREAFLDFEFERVARMNRRSVERLVTNAGIVRHRGKIESTLNNARRALEVAEEFASLSNYFWQFQPASTTPLRKRTEIQTTTTESKAMSRDLKRRGWTFVGPTTCYAFMQSMGLVNDHLVGCHCYAGLEAVGQRGS